MLVCHRYGFQMVTISSVVVFATLTLCSSSPPPSLSQHLCLCLSCFPRCDLQAQCGEALLVSQPLLLPLAIVSSRTKAIQRNDKRASQAKMINKSKNIDLVAENSQLPSPPLPPVVRKKKKGIYLASILLPGNKRGYNSNRLNWYSILRLGDWRNKVINYITHIVS